MLCCNTSNRLSPLPGTDRHLLSRCWLWGSNRFPGATITWELNLHETGHWWSCLLFRPAPSLPSNWKSENLALLKRLIKDPRPASWAWVLLRALSLMSVHGINNSNQLLTSNICLSVPLMLHPRPLIKATCGQHGTLSGRSAERTLNDLGV